MAPMMPSVSFDLPEPAVTRLRIYDVAGRLVRRLVDGDQLQAGRHKAVWNGRDDAGRQVSTGVYLCRLEAGDFRETKRMMLIR